ncbi:MAG: hypothetical protein FWE00_03395 [Defluviitaleaceae bacterium]|nr:hypothetical protein [Defluviitaleaceae bacterium]
MGISECEVRSIMKEEKITRLDRDNFCTVMKRGSSDICQYINREAELCAPPTYTMDDIAYIYGLNIEDVIKAGDITGIHEATALTLPCLFYHIPVE